ncbi:MAG: hypothetical protein HQL10_03220 [Nitrospirae bacterium]|nr:hypothetical protein [Nitrospirota bacterium]
MHFTLIDYSEQYFTTLDKDKIPEERTGKFIQVINHNIGMEYLIMSPIELSFFHANIAEKFLSEQGIQGYYNAKKDKYYINNPEWEIVGGGMWTLDSDNKTLSFSGKSLAYGDFSPDRLKEKILAAGMFSDYALFVNGR